MNESHYDFVIVGAGSAGCVLARRLTEDADVTVLVIEAGGVAPSWDFRVHMPAALSWPLADDRYNWYYHTEPEPHLDGRRMYCPRGRVVGGSSSINGMVYIRGNALDYDEWARIPGLDEWSYRHCLPYFKKAESRDRGADDYHGGDGPLGVATPKWSNPLFRVFVDAGVQAGYARTDDLNGYRQEGFGPMDATTRGGRRASAHHGFRRILLLNGHGGNAAALAATTTQLSEDHGLFVASLSYWSLVAGELAVIGESEPGGMGHAGEMETSIALHLRPDRVGELPAADVPATGAGPRAIDFRAPGPVVMPLDLRRDTQDGVIGDPTAATAEKGERIVAAVVERLVAIVDDLLAAPVDAAPGTRRGDGR